jgi:hypothetical protein
MNCFIIGKIKCCFCREKDGIMESVCDHGIYGEVGGRIFYHPQCLEMIELSPEKYGHIMADQAINVNDLRKMCLQFNDTLEETFQKKVEKLQRNHFEKMLPYWSRHR